MTAIQQCTKVMGKGLTHGACPVPVAELGPCAVVIDQGLGGVISCDMPRGAFIHDITNGRADHDYQGCLVHVTLGACGGILHGVEGEPACGRAAEHWYHDGNTERALNHRHLYAPTVTERTGAGHEAEVKDGVRVLRVFMLAPQIIFWACIRPWRKIYIQGWRAFQ